MKIDFSNIEYLKTGNDRQQHAYHILIEHKVLTKLHSSDPILVGTIPIEIDIENSDLDIICYYENRTEFAEMIKEQFGNNTNFKIEIQSIREQNVVVANFQIDTFEIEIFGQNIPTRKQNAYRHMLIEHQLLQERGEAFQQKIIELKKQGYKTEPAFAKLLGIKGDPFVELLKYEMK